MSQIINSTCPTGQTPVRRDLGRFERWLSLWVLLCIAAGILLGHWFPGLASSLDRMSLTVDGAPVISLPIAA